MTTAQLQRTDGPPLVAGTAFTLGKMSEGDILQLAAAGTGDSRDPVDVALNSTLARDYPGMGVPAVDAADIDPATPARRFSLTRVRDWQAPDGTVQDLVVMRGDLDSILGHVKVRWENRSIIKKKSSAAILRGWRPLAVATAPVGAQDAVGQFTMQGFIGVTSQAGSYHSQGDLSASPAIWARINVWSPSLRVQHWCNVALIFILSCTGFYIMSPFFGPSSYTGAETGFLMGWVRLVHFAAAFLWVVLGLTRVWSAFTSSDRYLRWSAMWPLKSKDDVRNLGHTLLHYVFVKTEGPVYLGHNPLQQLTYTGVYVVCGLQMLVGFVLFGLPYQSDPFWAFVSTPIHWFGVPAVRMVHTIIMFLLWAFVIVHVYLVFRADSVERHGGLSAMVNGGVWMKRGTKPVDAPMVE